jgi:hypothetical protein
MGLGHVGFAEEADIAAICRWVFDRSGSGSVTVRKADTRRLADVTGKLLTCVL